MTEPPAQAAISVDMGGTKIYGILNRLDGSVLAEQTLPTTNDGFAQLVRLINALLADASAQGVDVIGIGLGVPGMTSAGRVIAAPALGWLDEPIADRLHAEFGLPVVVENDVNLAALGEYRFGAAKGAQSLICIAVGTGIGSGIVINGALHRGAHHSAGEIGYILVDPAQFRTTFSNADFGAFEQLASGTGIQARARTLLHQLGEAELGERVTSEVVVSAAQRGESWALHVVEDTVQYLALGLTNVTAVLDPEVIVLTGGVMRAPELFVAPLEAHLRRLIPFQPRIVVSTLGPRAAALGATALIVSAQAR